MRGSIALAIAAHRPFRALLVLALGCGGVPAPRVAAPERVAIAAVERGPNGARIVAIDELGDRRFELVQPAATFVRDTSPAISPDGRWLVFASTRGRTKDETSLWIAAIGPEARPIQLTRGPAIDAHPAWTPDGRALVFASTREGGDFDLFQISVAPDGSATPPVQLTRGEHHEVMPSVAPDGAIVYAVVRPLDDRRVASHLEELAAGQIRRLTEGPADSAPAVSPDGKTIAFAHGGDAGEDLWTMPRDGATPPTRVVELPLTEETGPVWSRDGRYLFATSIYRGDERRPLFSSVIHVDLRERPRRARMLADRAGPIVRLSPAIVARTLDAGALRRDPEYVAELARVMTEAITRLQMQQQGTPP